MGAADRDGALEVASPSEERRKRDLLSAEANICTICLNTISERAVATPCNHLEFDFHCLVQWLQASASCPLCKAEVSEVQYDFRAPQDFKRYIVPKALKKPQSTSDDADTPSGPTEHRCGRTESPALALRREVYEHQVFSQHIGDNRVSGHKAFSPKDSADSSELQNKARIFLRRELQVFDERLAPDAWQAGASRSRKRVGTGVTIHYLIEYIVTILRMHEIKSYDGRAQELISEFIGLENARLLLHEVDAWLRSPYSRLADWDEAVQYTT